jgi:hypothetical protein
MLAIIRKRSFLNMRPELGLGEFPKLEAKVVDVSIRQWQLL